MHTYSNYTHIALTRPVPNHSKIALEVPQFAQFFFSALEGSRLDFCGCAFDTTSEVDRSPHA